MRRTKVVATLGPSTQDAASIRSVLDAGADVVRLNGAHATTEWHARTADLARRAARDLGRNLGVLVDLPGPKLRIGEVPDGEIELAAGETFVLMPAGERPAERGAETNVPDLPGLVSVGDPVWLADGEIVLEVERAEAGVVVTEVVRGGILRSRKGLALPGAEGVLDPFTPADESILEFALRIDADLVGVSFVRSANDVERVRAAIGDARPPPLLVAKIETRSALDGLDAIVAAADAVMVARGDLGVQIDIAHTPLAQKQIIALCNRSGRPVITATQMLESMTRSPLPTRAEATDVVNAVLDGTDALMLSEETGVGAYPAEAVATMVRLAISAESWDGRPPESSVAPPEEPVAAVARAAVRTAREAGAAAIVCRTTTGATARRIAALRPGAPIVAVTPDDEVAARLAVVWGVVAIAASVVEDDPAATVDAARAAGAVPAGELIAVVASPPPDGRDHRGSVHLVPT